MKVRKYKHRRIVTPWYSTYSKKAKFGYGHRRLIMGPLSYSVARSVLDSY